jgi:PAS domain S-box-containing protein
MVWQRTPWADPLLFSTVVSATLAVFGLLYVAVVRRDDRVVGFAVVMIAAATWTFGYSFQFASDTLAAKTTWAAVAMAGEAIVPPAWFSFAAAYTQRDHWLRLDRAAVVWLVPLVTLVLTATNATHGLVWEVSQLATAPSGSYVVLERAGGPWLLVHGAVSYLLAVVGTAFLVGAIERYRRVYWGQAAALSVGIVVPAAANLASLANVGPARVVDLTPPSITVLGIAFAVAIFRYRLFDLVPVARASVVENMNEGYVLLDESEDVVDLNAAARSLLGGTDERLLGRDARAVFSADLSVLAEFDGETTTETIQTGPDADDSYLQLTVSTVEADNLAGCLLVVRDVTDRLRLERRFQALIEATSDVVLVVGEDGVIDYASPSVERVLGYDPDALADSVSFGELVVDDLDDVDAPTPAGDTTTAVGATDGGWRQALDVEQTASSDDDESGSVDDREATDDSESESVDSESGDSESVDSESQSVDSEGGSDTQVKAASSRTQLWVETADGDERIVDVIARDLTDDPAVGGIVVNARDVTERRRREFELERTNERLDRFASVVSHDLRNPLQVAAGRLQIGIETGDEESLEIVQRQHDRMEEMIEDLLAMARDGKEVEETAPVDVGDAAREAWRSVETSGASLTVARNTTILADDSRLSNLFENLFRNAVEHAVPDDGDPADLDVRVESIPDGFAVEDNGVGIPPEKRAEVVDSGYTTVSGNTGYGLAIVHDIAAAHGWELELGESSSGGARFEICGVDRPETVARTNQPPESDETGDSSDDAFGGRRGEDGSGEFDDRNETAEATESETADETARPTESETADGTARPTESETTDETARPTESETVDETARPTEPETADETARPTEPETADEIVGPTEPERAGGTEGGE